MTDKKLDKLIEAEYYRQADGLQINVMDIPKLWDHARMLVGKGATVNYAVQSGIEMYCREEAKNV